jgi:hypothetical protein
MMSTLVVVTPSALDKFPKGINERLTSLSSLLDFPPSYHWGDYSILIESSQLLIGALSIDFLKLELQMSKL